MLYVFLNLSRFILTICCFDVKIESESTIKMKMVENRNTTGLCKPVFFISERAEGLSGVLDIEYSDNA